MIDSYEFGVIVINGKRYASDVIVLPEKVIYGWWRREGHNLCPEDIQEIIKHKPKIEVLIVGTGYYGLMKISPEVNNVLKSRGIELISQPTKEACQTFNNIIKSNKLIAGAFHLTC
jgi:hypothetical protein